MPSAWIHAVIDLIAYGEPYFDLHKEKDKSYKTLRWNHRKIKHEWYQSFGEKWTFDDPFPNYLRDLISRTKEILGPNRTEELMADVDHDYIDRIWDDLSNSERMYWEGFFAWILFMPKILKKWAGVDALKGRNRTFINGNEVWESTPELRFKYKRLINYVKIVKKNNKDLKNILKRFVG